MTELTSSVSTDSRTSMRRRPGGPVGGSAVLTRLTVEVPAPSKGAASGAAVADLFAAVLATDPAYLPGVASGEVAFESWYRRKDPQWVRVARTPVMEPGVAGHVGVRLNGLLPDGRLLEDAGAPRLSWELGMLVVRPGVRGCGIASALVAAAAQAFSCPLWASVHADGPGHRLLDGLGWEEATGFRWAGDPVPGLVMFSPLPRTA